MSNTMTPNKTIDACKAEYDRAKGRMITAINTTPDDKVNWSTAPTARTPVEIVVHAALATEGIRGWLAGEAKAEDFNPVTIDSDSREKEAKYKSREDAVALLEKNSAAYFTWLDTLSDEQLASTLEGPFGAFPLSEAITFPADHLRGHVQQIEYIQTMLGDRVWH